MFSIASEKNPYAFSNKQSERLGVSQPASAKGFFLQFIVHRIPQFTSTGALTNNSPKCEPHFFVNIRLELLGVVNNIIVNHIEDLQW